MQNGYASGMTEPLRVSDTSLRAVAAGCAELTTKLISDAIPSSNLGLPCQPSTAAIETLLADAESARAALAERMKDTSAEFASAATAYANTDADGAASLSDQMM